MSESILDRSAIDDLRAQFRGRLPEADSEAALKTVADAFLGRKSGAVTGVMKRLGTLQPEARREVGALINALKSEIEEALEQKRAAIASSQAPAGTVDVTLPGRELPLGRIHPLMRV